MTLPNLPICSGFKYPFYPLDSYKMPLPGPDFLEVAHALGDKETKLVKDDTGNKSLTNYGEFLQKLYYGALYNPAFSIRVKVKGRNVTPTFVRGHLWGYQVTGPRPARIMVVGKLPGPDEEKSGRNMAGQSGRLMVSVLEQNGLKKEEYDKWYVTNCVKHGNLDQSANKTPKQWIKNCQILLEQELRIVRPEFILALGAEAVKELAGDGVSVTVHNGQIYDKVIHIDKDHSYTAKVLVCTHPAHVLRASDKMPEFSQSIKRFIRLIKGLPLDVEEEVDHRVIYCERDLAALVDQIIEEGNNEQDPQIIAIDCEWHGEYPTEPNAWLRTIQFSHKPGFAGIVALRSMGGKQAFWPSPAHAIPHLKRLLINTASRRVRLGGHAVRADLPWINSLDKELGEALIKQLQGADTAEGTRSYGGFDTMIAAHAVTEAPGELGFKLEVLALNVCGVRRYDGKLTKWKNDYCKQNKISSKDLDGYGACPDLVLEGRPYEIQEVDNSPYCGLGTPVRDSYSGFDSDATRRLIEAYNRPGGLLDVDQFGNSSRIPFWRNMRCQQAALEMEMTGILLDHKLGDLLTDNFMEARNELIEKLHKLTKWETFNLSSYQQCAALLFGNEYAGKRDKEGNTVEVLPKGVKTLGLTPIKTAGKKSKQWDKVVARREEHLFNPSTDKEVLGALSYRLVDRPEYDVVSMLRYARFATKVLQGMLREPLRDIKTNEIEIDEEGLYQYEKGLLGCMHIDNRLRTHFYTVKETSRWSSARPPIQNLSSKREAEYKKILGDKYSYPLRSIIAASPGYVLVESDYIGAELFILATQSCDDAMIDHCMRAALPESDPKFYDMHANMAVKAFKLDCPPTKAGLSSIGKSSLRIAAKTILFGLPYGRGDEAIIRTIEEEGVYISAQEAESIREQIFSMYPRLGSYLEKCEQRTINPGWMCSCFQRYRRFNSTGIDDGGDAARQAKNFGIQNGVADAIDTALDHLYNYSGRLDKDQLKYRLVIQLHDAIMSEVRIEDIEWYVDEVLPNCMTKNVPIYPCDLDGKRIEGRGPYFMGIETKVALHWGTKITAEEGKKLNIPARFCAKKGK